MITTTKNNQGFVAGIITATAASLCCITPVLAFLGGASGLASSFSWIEPFRPYLTGLTILFFSLAWYQKLRPQKQADCSCETSKANSFLKTKMFLAFMTVFAALLLSFPYYAQAFYPKSHAPQTMMADKQNIKQAIFAIKGMTCEGCTQHVNSELSKVKGVVSYQTSYEKANSIVKFDNSKTSIDSISNAIKKTGYKVTAQHILNN